MGQAKKEKLEEEGKGVVEQEKEEQRGLKEDCQKEATKRQRFHEECIANASSCILIPNKGREGYQ